MSIQTRTDANGRAAAARIDALLHAATEAGEVPGVVALAADADGAFYEGAFGQRRLGDGPAMTPDTLFRLYSLTKVVTSVAAMQLVEDGRLALDAPVPDIGEPVLSAPQVLDGFDDAGRPLLRPARRPITLGHLLTHTAGFTYGVWNADARRYSEITGIPLAGAFAACRRPLNFDPGERWEYGVNIDWVGRLVEATSGQSLEDYMRERLFAPLRMNDTGFLPTRQQHARQASVHQRQADGHLEAQPLLAPSRPDFFAGGSGLYSTGPDYLRFLRMLLQDGSLDGNRILKPETVALMDRNHIGDLPAGTLTSYAPDLSNDVDFFPGSELRWGLGGMLNLEPGPNGRSAGTVGWAGLGNLYYWLDPVRRIAGVIMTQILPFADPAAVRLYGRFERGVYALADAG